MLGGKILTRGPEFAARDETILAPQLYPQRKRVAADPVLLRQMAYMAAKPGYPVAVVLAGTGAGSLRRTRNEGSENGDLDIRRSRCRRSNWRSDARDGHLDLHRRWRRCWDWRGSWQALTVKAQSSASIATAACYGRTHAVVAARPKRRLSGATVPKDTRKDQLRGGKREVIPSQFPLGAIGAEPCWTPLP
jgi:hypothetical protein